MRTLRSGGHLAGALAVTCFLTLTSASAPAAERGVDGHFDRRRSSHFVLYQDVDIDRRSGWGGSIAFERDVLDALEQGHRRLGDLLGLRPRRPITVVIYDPAVFEREFAPLFRFPTAGFYQGTIHVRGRARVTPRLLHVLHHELLHAALDQSAPSYVFPGWLNEGLAEWFASRALRRRHLHAGERQTLGQAARSGQLRRLDALSPSSFGHLHPNEVPLAYLESYAFVDYLARRYGADSLRELCDKLLHSRDLSRTLQRVFRADLEQLEAGFRSDTLGLAG